jgi:hypothetical protein
MDKQCIYRALSVRQPWAWLIAHGYKDVENRTWRTTFRGMLYVHAGRRIDHDGIEWCRAMFPDIELPTEYPTGGIVGSAEVVGCVDHSASAWFVGPYGFVLSGAAPCRYIPLAGRLGLFAVDEGFLHPHQIPCQTKKFPKR